MKRTLFIILALFMLLPAIVSCSGSKLMEYDGYTITEDMYHYWVKSWKNYYVENFSDVSDTPEFWQAMNVTGVTNEKYITEQIDTRIKYYLIAQKLFDDYKLKLDDETKEAIETDIEDQIEAYGSKSEFNEYLKEEFGINISTLRKIYTAEEKYTAVYNYLYNNTSGVHTSTPDELDAYYHKYYVRVKYVMFFKKVKYVYDEDGKRVTDPATGYYSFEDLSEEEQDEVVSKVNEVYDALLAGGNIDEYMIKCMEEFEFDPSLYPNGFYISADDYVSHTADVTGAALEMEIGEIRKIENDDYYFVVQKFDLIDKAYATLPDSDQFQYLVSYSNNEKFSVEFNKFAEEIKIDSDAKSKFSLTNV